MVVANRLPVDLERKADGTEVWKRSPGGLVTALESVLQASSGAWVGWPGVADAHPDSFVAGGIELHSVPLSAEEIELYYEGFSNGTLWPLFHDVVVQPEYHRHWWAAYVEVNRRFAEAAAAATAEDGIVWVQDYQLLLVPKMLRQIRPDLTIGFFQHIPFPPVELFMQLPWRTEIIDGMLGADLVGFHLPGGVENFLYLSSRLAGYETSRRNIGTPRRRSRSGVVHVGFREVKVGAFPISIASGSISERSRGREVRQRAREIRRELGSPKLLMLGVDRLDYTKGIDVRLRALEELISEGRIDPGDVSFVQIATPSRERVEQYRTMRVSIEHGVSRINGMFGTIGHPIVTYLHRPIPQSELLAFYAAADIMLVTPIRDGMNLVAKEYVAASTDGKGALVLSEFTGAAAELRQAYKCNPHDLDGVKDVIELAVDDEPEKRRRRMSAMRRQVLTHDVTRWARLFLTALGGDELADKL
ncbi:alpha,alpha-trehalose-phosphate synthase (UDP-forming) [Dietzia sp.]|uniref:alpha,alpha-trehalose-phosphate synthase (UDP-forming) n=1 Tax=Dietzia sp. TaxID=1871616 RepID=UPI002FD9C2F5